MHRVIVPVDFSDTALNAARFVGNMLAGKPSTVAILYHNYKDPQDHEMCVNYLESLKMELLHPIRRGICEMRGTIYIGDKLVTEAVLVAQIVKRPKE